MCDEEKEPEDRDADQPQIEEVTTDFGEGIKVRSGFSIEDGKGGHVGIHLFGPILVFDDDDLGFFYFLGRVLSPPYSNGLKKV